MLVKNLSADTTDAELTSLFGKYGQLASVLLTPSNTLGLVEFLEVGEAKRAFRSLAYYKHKGMPLYLEWAPVGLKQEPKPASAAPAVAEPSSSAAAETAVEEDDDDGANAASGEGCTIFVKNLNFKSTETELKALFTSRKYKVRSASIVTRKDRRQATRSCRWVMGSSSL